MGHIHVADTNHTQPSALSPLLQAKESIEQLVYLCQTDKEPVREAAKQSLMLCGECPASPLLTAAGGASPPCHTAQGREGPGLIPACPVLRLMVPKLCGVRVAVGRIPVCTALSVGVICYLLDGTERTI